MKFKDLKIRKQLGIAFTVAVVPLMFMSIAKLTGEVFSKMLPEIKRTTVLVQEIATASREQASGGAQINTAVQRFNDGIQQFATISEEVASNSQNLLQQADRLQDVIKFFKVRGR